MVFQVGEHFRREQVGHYNHIHRMLTEVIRQGIGGVSVGEIHRRTPGQPAVGIADGIDGPEAPRRGLGQVNIGMVHPFRQLPAGKIKRIQ